MAKTDEREVPLGTIDCDVCKKSVPASVAVSAEADEYVLFFCGLECHAQWEREQAQEVEKEFAEHSGIKRP